LEFKGKRHPFALDHFAEIMFDFGEQELGQSLNFSPDAEFGRFTTLVGTPPRSPVHELNMIRLPRMTIGNIF